MAEKNESVNSQTDAQEEVQSQDVEQETSEEQASTEQTDVNSDAQNESSSHTTSDEESTADEEENVDPKDEEIQQLKEQVKENEDKYLRLYAEFENYKKYQSQSVLTDILPTIDNIERALQIEGEDEQFQSLQKGVKMVHESLLKALEDNGLEVIKTDGEQFDPNYHQAVMQDDNPDYESGQITQELQTGYKLKDRVLRPSMVKVNQ